MLEHYLGGTPSFKGETTCGQVEQGGPQGVDVGTVIGDALRESFGGDVTDGSFDRFSVVGRGGWACFDMDSFGQSQIDQFSGSFACDQYISRFDIAMDDIEFECGVQAVGRVEDDLERPLDESIPLHSNPR
jgi:hypothetical protein